MKKAILLVLLMGYLGLWGEHLALFENGRVYTLPYPAVLYSREDQLALARGIAYATAQERAQLLEDYTS